MAGTTGLEPATSAVTGQRSNQLNYVPRGTNYENKPSIGLRKTFAKMERIAFLARSAACGYTGRTATTPAPHIPKVTQRSLAQKSFLPITISRQSQPARARLQACR
jgi:hypothetical protein